MEKTRYRLVYNRTNKLNVQGMALVQAEALLKLLGHTSLRTTELYADVFADTMVRDLRKVSQRRTGRWQVE